MNPSVDAGVRKPARTPRALAWLLLGALLFRLVLILAAPPDVYENGEPNQEELLRGIAAAEFVEGPVLPFFEHQVNHFWGGSLVTSLAAAPLFAVLGAKLWVLRLVGALFGVAACAFAFRLLDRHASRRAAWIGAALLAFPPPGYAYSGVMVFGTHLESNALALGLLATWLAWRAHEPNSALRTALFGLVAGFALYFGYGLLVVLALVAAFEFARDKGFVLRPWFRVFAAGFVVGFAPWIAYAAAHGFRGLDVYDAGLLEHFVEGVTRGTALDLQGTVHASPLEKLGAFLTRDLAEAQWFHGAFGIEGLGVAHAFLALVAAGGLVAAWRARAELAGTLHALATRARHAAAPTPAAFACAFVAAFVLVWITSDFAIGPRGFVFNFRYLMPLWPFLAIAAACGAAALLEARGLARRAAQVGIALVLVGSTTAALARCRPDHVTTALEAPATSRKWQVRSIVVRCGEDPAAMLAVFARIEERRSPSERDEIERLIGLGLRVLGNAPASTPREIARNVLYRRTLATLRERAPADRRAWFDPPPAR